MRSPEAVERIDVGPKDVEDALPIVQEVAVRTPILPFRDETSEVLLKLETMQRLGVFKIRGVWNRLYRLSEEDQKRGLATMSSGNHGMALAWASEGLGVPCTVHVPVGCNPRKIEAIRAHGARVRLMPRPEYLQTHEQELWRSWPETFIHPFAHDDTIAGQGTIGIEIAEDVPKVRTVLVPVGGGGLASGIALGVQSRIPGVKIFGVQAEGAASLPEALRTGRPNRVERPNTIADGIGLGMILPSMTAILTRTLDGCLLVSEDDIRSAMRTLAFDAKLVVEPAGAASFAAWTRYRDRLEAPVVAVVSGGNVDPKLLAEILRS
jgi:threonine dehydratase